LCVDHIFRVFSNTKLITSCAAMLLFEEGRFQLDDPIEQYIPQLANRRVLKPGATGLDDMEPARSPITIRHLLSHSAGMSYPAISVRFLGCFAVYASISGSGAYETIKPTTPCP
jgi:CubicO group peptidase (beta-lactamase class C family)